MVYFSDIEFGYIREIALKNIRGFKDLTISLKAGDGIRRNSVIIGRNGTGKSTLLRAIALALSPESDAQALLKFLGGEMVHEGEEAGEIRISVSDSDNNDAGQIFVSLKNEKQRSILVYREVSENIKDQFFVCGYGANRGLTGTSSDNVYRSFDAVATLFDYKKTLLDTEITLRRLFDYAEQDLFELTMSGIKRVLELSQDHQIEFPKGGGVQITGPDIEDAIPLDAWADGYRLTFTWVIDLYGRAMQAGAITDDGGVRGILLVDEIEQHLHPSMQSELINQLHDICPELQIFATTHSPLTALGVGEENVISLKRFEETGEIRRVSVPSLGGYSVEDALIEEALFGTKPFPKHTQEQLETYRKLAKKPVTELSNEETQKLQELIVTLDPSKMLGREDDPINEKLDKVLRLLEEEEERE